MANKAKEAEVEEEMCEECGSEHNYKKMKKEETSSKAKKMQMQDEYDMEDEEEKTVKEAKKMAEEDDMEDEEEMEEGSYMKKESKTVKEAKKMAEEDDMEDEEEDEEDEEDEDEMEESFKTILKGKGLSEEFQLEVSTLFEATVNTRVKKIEEQLASKFTQLLESEVEDIANNLTEKVDSYLNYVVTEWMEENKLAVERGIRTDIAESFITGLKDLFVEHNISVPEDQTDLLDETASNLQKVTEELNKQIKKSVDLTEELKKYQRAEIFAKETDGLSSAQIEKLRSLAENMEYSDNKEFAAKLHILKENYAKPLAAEKPVVSSIQVEDATEPQQLTEGTTEIGAYLSAMLRKNK
jgi:small-conductance mechanosensitive channel